METNKNIKNFAYVVLALLIVLIAFVLIRKNKSNEIEGDYIFSDANVEDFDVVLKESFPVQVDLLVKGTLPDSCTELGESSQQLIGDTFKVVLQAKKLKDEDIVCAQMIKDFDTVIPLENVVGISAGEYTVDLNGVQKKFKMDVDNYISNEDPLK